MSCLDAYLEDRIGLGLGIVVDTGEVVVVLLVSCEFATQTYPFHFRVLVTSAREVESMLSASRTE